MLTAVVGAPLALTGVVLRPGWRPGWRERLGRGAACEPGAVWVHGASLGEVHAALPLIDRLQAGGRRVCASSMTSTGREALRRARPTLPSRLAPLDHPWCVEAALSRVDPCALVLVETELWPAWIAAAARRGVPVIVVSGRISERSFPRYTKLGALLRPTLQRLAAVGARTPRDAERYVVLGVPAQRVRVTGDLKLDGDARAAPLAADLAAALGELPLLVAGSTHAGEEAAALDALAAAERLGVQAGLVLAPRYPERVAEVEAQARRAERRVRRRSALGAAPLQAGEVLVLDSVGELATVYASARVAFVGGSLVPRGGHNVLEPAQQGRPVLFGPHTRSCRESAELLLASGGARRVADAAELCEAAAAWLADPAAADAAGARARAALAAHRGSAQRAAALVEEVLGAKEKRA